MTRKYIQLAGTRMLSDNKFYYKSLIRTLTSRLSDYPGLSAGRLADCGRANRCNNPYCLNCQRADTYLEYQRVSAKLQPVRPSSIRVGGYSIADVLPSNTRQAVLVIDDSFKRMCHTRAFTSTSTHRTIEIVPSGRDPNLSNVHIHSESVLPSCGSHPTQEQVSDLWQESVAKSCRSLEPPPRITARDIDYGPIRQTIGHVLGYSMKSGLEHFIKLAETAIDDTARYVQEIAALRYQRFKSTGLLKGKMGARQGIIVVPKLTRYDAGARHRLTDRNCYAIAS